MAVSGHYNHYDDPDEFWDEEPLVPRGRATVPSPVVSGRGPDMPTPIPVSRVDDQRKPDTDIGDSDAGDAGHRGSQPPRKIAFVDVEVGGDGLPTAVDLQRGWKNAYLPSEYGESIVEAYRFGLYELTMRYVKSGVRPKSHLPTLREAAPMLLQARTYERFSELYNSLFDLKAHTVYGPDVNEYGEPALVVTATRSRLVSVKMDAGWTERVDAVFVAQDVLDCCNRIRSMKLDLPRDMYLERESNRELIARLARHRQQLLWNEV